MNLVCSRESVLLIAEALRKRTSLGLFEDARAAECEQTAKFVSIENETILTLAQRAE